MMDEFSHEVYFKNSIKILSGYSWIYNVRMTEIFSKQALMTFPAEWKRALLELTLVELNKVPFGFNKENWPASLQQFLSNSIQLGNFRFDIPNNAKSHPADILDIPDNIKRGMSPKKITEVSNMALLIKEACDKFGCTAIMDVGSGLGYLAQVLHNSFGYYIFGIDCNESNCQGANIRICKSNCNKNVFTKKIELKNDKESCENITDHLNRLPAPVMCSCVKDGNPPDLQKWMLVSLHACGNLTPNMLELFQSNSKFVGLICVGCCYHKLYDRKTGLTNFPMSKQLTSLLDEQFKLSAWKPCSLGLRLASQNTRSNWLHQTQSNHDEHVKHIAYRAVLEVYLAENNLQWTRPARRISKKNFRSFDAYRDVALNEELLKDKESLAACLRRFEGEFKVLEIYTLLQVVLQPVWEGLVLFDRVFYLQQKNFTVSLRTIACDSLSPRNIAILAFK